MTLSEEPEQALLQDAADALVQRLGLPELLAPIGTPVRVGSSALGLMVRRDIDITVVCDRLDAQTLAAFAGVGATLMAMTGCVGAVRFRNDAETWNVAPNDYPDGYYLGVSARDEAGNDWTLDIWAIDDPGRQPDLWHLETLPSRLTGPARASILRIKRHLVAAPSAGKPPPSAWVYEAVLDHGVVDAAGFALWVAGRTADQADLETK